MTQRQPQSGFTLIELSIVLVIIALVVSGVLVGREMIRQAELRSVLRQLDGIKSAIHTFEGKYDCLPGDCNDASTRNLGSNGNGNNVVDDGWLTYPQITSAAGNVELFLVWQHLGNAQLIPGTYSGAAGPGSVYESVVGVNAPASKFPGGGWSVINAFDENSTFGVFFGGVNWSQWSGADKDWQKRYTNALIIGGQSTGDRTWAPLFTATDAMSIDRKVDDGMPGTGSVVTLTNQFLTTPNCTTSWSPYTAQYNTAYQGLACHLVFNNVF
jgi:prepilin-type N-terminal cleavage/methylation domain-containing protein